MGTVLLPKLDIGFVPGLEPVGFLVQWAGKSFCAHFEISGQPAIGGIYDPNDANSSRPLRRIKQVVRYSVRSLSKLG